jgi:hypothetical protein
MTRSAYLQVKCAVGALWSEHQGPYARCSRRARAKLDSFFTTFADTAKLASDRAPTGGRECRPLMG